jgi:hypothetical protein
MPMITVASATSGFEAKLLAARLGSEGVVWELRPDVDGVYPVTDIEIRVPADEAERARAVLDAEPGGGEVDGWAMDFDEAESGGSDVDGLGGDGLDGDGPPGDGDIRVDVIRRHRRGLATLVLAVVVAFMVARLIALG